MVLQLVVDADEEIQHLVAELVGLVEDHQRGVLFLEGLQGVEHHIRDGAGGLDAEATQQLRQEVLPVPVLAAAEVIDVAVGSGVGLDGLGLAATGVSHHGQHQGVVLGVG